MKRALGRPQLVNERSGAYTEYAWDFGAWTVGLQNGRVVQISTTSRAQKTTTGVGMRTKIERVLGAFPGGVCTSSRGFGSATPPDPRFRVRLLPRVDRQRLDPVPLVHGARGNPAH